MKTAKLILTLSVIIVLVSLVLLLVTLNKYGITGLATDDAYANLTINAQASVAFVDETCDFSTGYVDEIPEIPFDVAYVYTNGTATINGTGWDGCDGLSIQNDGNVNVSVAISSDVDADGFIGGTGPSFTVLAVPDSCDGTSSTNTSYGAFGTVCSDWPMAANATIDFALEIPENALPGAKGAVITATATA